MSIGSGHTVRMRMSEQKLTIRCSSCGEGSRHLVGTLLTQPSVVCPACGHQVAVDATPLREKMDAAQARRDALRKSLKLV